MRGQKQINKYASPSLETDYSYLPPALSYVGSIDPFCDETKDYINNLRKAKIKTKFKIYDGCFHAFDMLIPLSKEAKEAKNFFLDNYLFACQNYYKKQ